MMYSNSLSTFILHHDINGLWNKNLHSIQYLMWTSEPYIKKFKRVCGDFPKLDIPIKSATPGEVKPTFDHASVSKNALGESVTAFTLAELFETLAAIYIDAGIDFTKSGPDIRIPVTKVLLRNPVSDLASTKKQSNWVALNAVLLCCYWQNPPYWMVKR